MKPVSLISALVFTLLLSGCSKKEEGWPRWRGPNGDSISTETDWDPKALAGGPKILWKADVGLGYSNVVIKNNRLYTMGRKRESNIVYCLNAKTGKEIWQYVFNSAQETQSTPCIDGESIYTLSKAGILLCLKANNGKLRWKRDLVSEYDVTKPYYGFAASPVIEGDLIILTANNYGMALDKRTGEMVWISEKPPKLRFAHSTGPHYSTPVMYDYEGKRYSLISNYEGLHSVEVATGKRLWTYEWDPFRRYATEPIFFDNMVFITRYNKAGSILLDIGGGEPKILWINRNMSSDTTSPVLIDGYIYGCDGGPEVGQGTLRCLNVQTGELMWEEDLRAEGETSRFVTASLIAADGKLIILEGNGTLHIAKATPSSYQEISSSYVLKGVFWTHPVLYKARIYCRNYHGDLICIDVSMDS